MRIYRIWVDRYSEYDSYDSAVVVAESEHMARLTHPSGDNKDWCLDCTRWGWVTDPRDVNIELIGDAAPGAEACVVVASFNAR